MSTAANDASRVTELDRNVLLERLRDLGPLIDPIQGWLDPNAGGVLYQLARLRAPVPTVVELGSWKGRSTAWLGMGLLDRGEGRVVAVDTWAGTSNEPGHAAMLANYAQDQLFDEFRANMARLGLERRVEPWRMTTLEAARRWSMGDPIGVLHIDAAHDYDSVRQDFEFWSPFVAKGGFVVLDDVPTWPGPSQLVTELPRWFSHFGTSPNQWVVVRV
jgi:predicted O-methyltransferase YrrM